MDREQLMLLNRAARELYQPTNLTLQKQADQTFSQMAEDSNNLAILLQCLQHGEKFTGYAASAALKKLSEQRLKMPVKEQVGLANEMLSFMMQNYTTTTDSYIIGTLCDVFANICKFNITHQEPSTKVSVFRQPLNDLRTVASEVNPQGALALTVLKAVVAAFDEPKTGETPTEHKIAHNEFQNRFLRELNTFAVEKLIEASEMLSLGRLPAPTETYLQALLSFYKRVLEYEYLGMCYDYEERDTIDVPSSWRTKLLTLHVPIFTIYHRLPNESVDLLNSVLVIAEHLSCVRRTLYDTEDRAKVVLNLLKGILTVLSNVTKLGNSTVFATFSRFLYRLSKNYTFTDFNKHAIYNDEVLPLISQFTCQAFQAFDSTGSNGAYYLLSYWQRITSTNCAASSDSAPNSFTAVKPVVLAFIQSRMRLCELVSMGDAENPFDDQVSIQQFMESFNGLCRIHAFEVHQELQRIYNENTTILGTHEPSSQQYLLADLKMIYWTYITGTFLENKDCYRDSSFEDSISVDVGLFVNLVTLSKFNLERLAACNSTELPDNVVQMELATLAAYDRFRLSYINQTQSHFPEIQETLAARLGRKLDEQYSLLEIFVEKVTTNLHNWTYSEDVMAATLALLAQLTTNSLSQKVMELKSMQFMVVSHDADNFPFLGSMSAKHLSMRSRFYAALMRVVSSYDTEEKVFEDFLRLDAARCKYIGDAIGVPTANAVSENQLKWAVAGLARDLKGLCEGAVRIHSYPYLSAFAHFHKVFNIFQQAVCRYPDDPIVTVSILKCCAEFLLSRNSRLSMQNYSYRTLAIFHGAAKTCEVLFENFLRLPTLLPTDERFYPARVKVVIALVRLVVNVLAGNYLPVAVSYMYNDNTFQNLISMTFRVIRPYVDASKNYQKLTTSMFLLLHDLIRNYLPQCSHLSLDDIGLIFHYLENGFVHPDKSRVLNATTAFERITNPILSPTSTFETAFSVPSTDNVKIFLESRPDLLERYYRFFFQMTFYDMRQLYFISARSLYNISFLMPKHAAKWYASCIGNEPAEIQNRSNEVFSIFSSEPYSVDVREDFCSKVEDLVRSLRDYYNEDMTEATVGKPGGSGVSAGDSQMDL